MGFLAREVNCESTDRELSLRDLPVSHRCIGNNDVAVLAQMSDEQRPIQSHSTITELGIEKLYTNTYTLLTQLLS